MSSLTPALELAWQFSAAEAGDARHPRITPAHLLIGLLSLEKIGRQDFSSVEVPAHVRDSVEKEQARFDAVWSGCGMPAAAVRRMLRKRLGLGRHTHTSRKVSRSEASKRAFRRAEALAGGLTVDSLHLLAVLLENPDPIIRAVLEEGGAKPDEIARRALAHARGEPPANRGEARAAAESDSGTTPVLDQFGRDLTRLAQRGTLSPVIGRRQEILAVVQTLARSTKNNPVLVGEAGVGKTAIVEALAIRGFEGKDPQVLGGKRIVELNLGALVGGTQYRGEFEDRLTRLIEEARSHPEVLLFIDEIHTVVGAGRSGSGAMDAANLMKPALSRGDLRVIGATTPAEYHRYLESDSALERRFEKISIEEPSRDEMLEILRGLAPRFEQHHGVRIDPSALQAAIDLSLQFDAEHRLPDKAIDLVDKAAARARVPVLSMRAPDDPAALGGAAAYREEVTPLLVAQVLADKLSLPIELVAEGITRLRAPRVLDLERFLRGRLVGQDEAIALIASRLRMAYAGMRRERGALAVFLFLGPSGVGKTETARLMAEHLFGGEPGLLRFDMSEYAESHSVAKLIGSPPGYVGHEEEGLLTSRLRSRPHAVVLLDEVEKAHPRVFDLFLQVFDEGRITDAKNRSADARHAVFVMTSNLGTTGATVGFRGTEGGRPAEWAAPDDLRRFFRPEFLNRIDEQIVFRSLDQHDALVVLKAVIARLSDRLRAQHGTALVVEPAAETFLLREGFHPTYGVRELLRTVERLVQAPLATLVLDGKIDRHPAWRVVYDEGGLYLLPDPGTPE